MGAYNVKGEPLSSVYNIHGERLGIVYDRSGEIVFPEWYDEITVTKKRNDTAQTNYYLIIIPQTRPNGSKQYPFLFCPNGASGGTQSTLEMMRTYDFFFGMNAGYFDAFQTGSNKPYGITIENGKLIREAPEQYFLTNYTLTINEEGVLNYAGTMASGVTGEQILQSGAISATLGLVPLVVNHTPSGVESAQWASTDRAQRQIIGQYDNGDYAILTAEGRNFDNSQGFTVSEVQAVCISEGMKFAHALDGGGSTETVIGKTQLNTIYEGQSGRIVPTYLVFNGTDQFFVPNS